MAETEINVVNRPAIVSTALDAVVRGWPILLAAVSFGVWLVHLEGATTTNGADIIKVKTEIAERDVRWAADQKAQNDRVDRIEEGRTVNLQRLATVEEGLKGQREILQDIRAKIDRALMGHLGR